MIATSPFVMQTLFKVSSLMHVKMRARPQDNGHDNDLPHRTSIASEVSQETRKFFNCCSASSLLHDFLIVSINELEFNGREKRKSFGEKL